MISAAYKIETSDEFKLPWESLNMTLILLKLINKL
jgi:hypothetical protein